MWHSMMASASSGGGGPTLEDRAYTWDPYSFVSLVDTTAPASRGFRVDPDLGNSGALSEIRHVDADLNTVASDSTGELFNTSGTELLAKWAGGDFSDYQLDTTLTVNSGSGSGTGLLSTRSITLSAVGDLSGTFDMTTNGSTVSISVAITSTYIPTGNTRTGTLNLEITA